MSDECDVSKIVTTFLLNTCRLLQRLTKHRIQSAMTCGLEADGHPPDDEEAKLIPLITGSVAEFYIEPMLSLVSDVDVMFYFNTELAIPRGHPPPTQLPAEFHNYVKVYEITDSHLAGYVYLELRYLLTQCTDYGKYNYIEYDEREYYLQHGQTSNHGPAHFTDNSHRSLLSIDKVFCVRCVSWPPQATDWPTRHRNYGWPNSTTLDRVASNGCDMVGVAHRLCRQDEWMGEYHWRLSFSRA